MTPCFTPKLQRTRATPDANDRITEYNYDKVGRLASEKDATLFVRSYVYDVVGHAVRESYSRRTPTDAK